MKSRSVFQMLAIAFKVGQFRRTNPQETSGQQTNPFRQLNSAGVVSNPAFVFPYSLPRAVTISAKTV